MLSFVLLICATLFGTGFMQNKGALTKENLIKVEKAWLAGFCDDLNRQLLDELTKCSKKYGKVFKDAFRDCFKKSYKATSSFYEYNKAACKNKTIGEKYISCMGTYADQKGFLKQTVGHAKAEACNTRVLAKYGKLMPQLFYDYV